MENMGHHIEEIESKPQLEITEKDREILKTDDGLEYSIIKITKEYEKYEIVRNKDIIFELVKASYDIYDVELTKDRFDVAYQKLIDIGIIRIADSVSFEVNYESY